MPPKRKSPPTCSSSDQPTWKKYKTGAYDRPLHLFRKSTFMESETISTSASSLPVQKEKIHIHPLLAQSQFRLVGGKAKSISEKEYEKVQPAVRLASRILDCGALDNFFYAMWKGKYFQFEDEKKPSNELGFGVEIDVEDLRCPNGKRTRQKVRDSVRALAKYTHFCLKIKSGDRHRNNDGDDSDEDGFEGGDELESTTDSFTHTQWDTLHENGFKGWTSYTVLGKYVWQDALAAQKNLENTGDLPNWIGRHFELAVTLVHEIAHAYRGARMPRNFDWEPYFGNEIVAEVGYQLEKELFGGHLTRICEMGFLYRHQRRKSDEERSKLRGVFAIVEWPYQAQRESYLGEECSFHVRQEPQDDRSLTVAWRVPLGFMSSLFCDKTWKKEYSEDPESLKPLRDTGYCFHNKGVELQPVQELVTGDQEQNYVPSGYSRTTEGKDIGMIMRDVGNAGSAIPHVEKFVGESSPGSRPWSRPFQVGGRYYGLDLKQVQKKYSATARTWIKDDVSTKKILNDKRVKAFRP